MVITGGEIISAKETNWTRRCRVFTAGLYGFSCCLHFNEGLLAWLTFSTTWPTTVESTETANLEGVSSLAVWDSRFTTGMTYFSCRRFFFCSHTPCSFHHPQVCVKTTSHSPSATAFEPRGSKVFLEFFPSLFFCQKDGHTTGQQRRSSPPHFGHFFV